MSHYVIALVCVRKCNSKLRFAFGSSAAILIERNSFSLSNQSQRDVGFVSCIYGERSSTSTSTLLTDKTLQHHISIKFISINYRYKKYNIIFQGDKI